MNTIEISKEMLLIGLETRTSNAAELRGQGKILATVQKFYGEYLGNIVNRTDNRVLAVYTDYASDERGEYTYFLGVNVTSAEEVPVGLSVRSIPAAKYKTDTTNIGPVEAVVMEAWQKIWGDSVLKQERAYAADFEVYDERCQNPMTAQVDLFISIKN